MTMVGHGCCCVVRSSSVHVVHNVVHKGHIGNSSSGGSRRVVLSYATVRMSIDAAVDEMRVLVVWMLVVVVRRMCMSP